MSSKRVILRVMVLLGLLGFTQGRMRQHLTLGQRQVYIQRRRNLKNAYFSFLVVEDVVAPIE